MLVGFAGGEIQRQRLNHPLICNYGIVGLNVAWYVQSELSAVRHAHDEICKLCARGRVRPPVGEQVEMEAAPGALERVGVGATVGRVVVLPGGAAG